MTLRRIQEAKVYRCLRPSCTVEQWGYDIPGPYATRFSETMYSKASVDEQLRRIEERVRIMVSAGDLAGASRWIPTLTESKAYSPPVPAALKFREKPADAIPFGTALYSSRDVRRVVRQALDILHRAWEARGGGRSTQR